MTVLLPWFALVVTVLAGWAIIKRLSTSMVRCLPGLAMISFAVICGVHGFLPKGVKPSRIRMVRYFRTASFYRN